MLLYTPLLHTSFSILNCPSLPVKDSKFVSVMPIFLPHTLSLSLPPVLIYFILLVLNSFFLHSFLIATLPSFFFFLSLPYPFIYFSPLFSTLPSSSLHLFLPASISTFVSPLPLSSSLSPFLSPFFLPFIYSAMIIHFVAAVLVHQWRAAVFQWWPYCSGSVGHGSSPTTAVHHSSHCPLLSQQDQGYLSLILQYFELLLMVNSFVKNCS